MKVLTSDEIVGLTNTPFFSSRQGRRRPFRLSARDQNIYTFRKVILVMVQEDGLYTGVIIVRE